MVTCDALFGLINGLRRGVMNCAIVCVVIIHKFASQLSVLILLLAVFVNVLLGLHS